MACVLGLGIMCGVYVCYCTQPSRSCLLPICASPIFHFLISHLLVSSHFVVSIDSGVYIIILCCRLMQMHAKLMAYCMCLLWLAGVFLSLCNVVT